MHRGFMQGICAWDMYRGYMQGICTGDTRRGYAQEICTGDIIAKTVINASNEIPFQDNVNFFTIM